MTNCSAHLDARVVRVGCVRRRRGLLCSSALLPVLTSLRQGRCGEKKLDRRGPDLAKFGDGRRASFTRSKLIKSSRHWQTILLTSTLQSCSCRLRATSQRGCSDRRSYCRCLQAHGRGGTVRKIRQERRDLAKSGSKPRPGEILIGYSNGYVKAWLGSRWLTDMIEVVILYRGTAIRTKRQRIIWYMEGNQNRYCAAL
jgi:hypothetical protein